MCNNRTLTREPNSRVGIQGVGNPTNAPVPQVSCLTKHRSSQLQFCLPDIDSFNKEVLHVVQEVGTSGDTPSQVETLSHLIGVKVPVTIAIATQKSPTQRVRQCRPTQVSRFVRPHAVFFQRCCHVRAVELNARSPLSPSDSRLVRGAI